MARFPLERRRGRRPGTARSAKIGSGGKVGGKVDRPRAKGGVRGPKVKSADALPGASSAPSPRSPLARRTQEQRSTSSERGLLGAALELIAERGFRASSLQAIGERAGYSRGLVSHRFGSKEGLLRQLVTRMLDRWGTEVRAPAVGSRVGVEALTAVAGVHRKAIEQTPDGVRALYMLLFESLLDMPDLRRELARLDRQLREGTERSLRAGVKAGTIRADVDVPAQAALFLGVLRGITLQWLIDPNALDLERVYRELDAWLTRGLAS
jgi:AcrR family transcriptional regulator